MSTTISNLKKKLTTLITKNEDLKNIQTSCIVKKVNSYDYKTYIAIVDPSNETVSINATINANLYKHDINVGDKLTIMGDIMFYKDITFQINNYVHEVADKSNYENIYDKLKDEEILSIPIKPIPNIMTNIAVISSAHASGLKDFLDVISTLTLCNVYIFHITLQGNFMEEQFLDAMEKTKEYDIDAIIIIRGGGAKVDLEWFDNYNIAKSIKLSNIPVICGIGHETDHTIVDIVSDKSCTTPTQVSYFIKTIMSKQTQIIVQITHRIDSLLHEFDNSLKTISMVLENQQLLRKDINKEKLMEVTSLYNSVVNDVVTVYTDTSSKSFITSIDKSITQIDNCEKVWKDIVNKTMFDLNSILETQNIMMLNETTDSYIRTKQEYILSSKRKDKICIHFIDGTIYI
jgi:exodeoxyribonuclease VII large subunit